MENFVRRMIDEHAELKTRISKLEKFIYSDKSDNVNKVDFANMCIQLKAMRMYESALGARLVNQNIVFEDSQYYERVATIKESKLAQEDETKQER